MNDDTIETIFATELSFYGDLLADVEAGKLMSYSTLAAKDDAGHEAIRVWLLAGTIAIAHATLFAKPDLEGGGRLEGHTPDMDDPLYRAAFEA